MNMQMLRVIIENNLKSLKKTNKQTNKRQENKTKTVNLKNGIKILVGQIVLELLIKTKFGMFWSITKELHEV